MEIVATRLKRLLLAASSLFFLRRRIEAYARENIKKWNQCSKQALRAEITTFSSGTVKALANRARTQEKLANARVRNTAHSPSTYIFVFGTGSVEHSVSNR